MRTREGVIIDRVQGFDELRRSRAMFGLDEFRMITSRRTRGCVGRKDQPLPLVSDGEGKPRMLIAPLE